MNHPSHLQAIAMGDRLVKFPKPKTTEHEPVSIGSPDRTAYERDRKHPAWRSSLCHIITPLAPDECAPLRQDP